jgi:subtilisin family serine protease
MADYVRTVERGVERIRHVSRWLNAVSVEANSSQIAALAAMPFVRRLDVVRGYRRGRMEPSVSTLRSSMREKSSNLPIDYGSSFGQLEQINVPAIHDRGLHGEGVLIAVFDTGFRNLRHEVFRRLRILDRRDFVNGDRNVGNNRDRGDGDHGTRVLSVLGGFAEGELVGPAYGATFLLAKTEDTESETPVEEDNWAAAAEWAEARGADVISSSLGYLDFDSPFPDYSFEDMDGATAVTTIVAQMAAERGVVVVVSAGNQGFDSAHNTLGAPADGELVLSIGAVDSFGARADFSSVGRTADGRIKPDVMAQGVLVRTADPRTRDRYTLSDGTSFSCPLAAGVAALVLQAHPDWSVDRVRRAMRSTADGATHPDRLMGWGVLDALKAVTFKP